MPRKRDPRRDQAFEIWKQHGGNITNRAIAEQLSVPEKTIGGWKSKDNWNGVLHKKERSTPNEKSTKKARAPSHIDVEEPIAESGELTEKQRLFCLYYVKSFNQTMAAIKAGYSPGSAHMEGSRLMRNDKVAAYIRGIKGKMHQELFIDAMDVLNKYVQIAFADLTDYVSFGRATRVVDHDDNGPVEAEVNYIDFKESSEIDGTIVTEVKQGRDGISVKLADKMKALEMLTKYFDLLPDKLRRKLQEEKLKYDIAKVKIEVEQLKGKGSKDDQAKKGQGIDLSALSNEELTTLEHIISKSTNTQTD